MPTASARRSNCGFCTSCQSDTALSHISLNTNYWGRDGKRTTQAWSRLINPNDPFNPICPGQFGGIQSRREQIAFSGQNTNTTNIWFQNCGRKCVRIVFGYYLVEDVWPNINTKIFGVWKLSNVTANVFSVSMMSKPGQKMVLQDFVFEISSTFRSVQPWSQRSAHIKMKMIMGYKVYYPFPN